MYTNQFFHNVCFGDNGYRLTELDLNEYIEHYNKSIDLLYYEAYNYESSVLISKYQEHIGYEKENDVFIFSTEKFKEWLFLNCSMWPSFMLILEKKLLELNKKNPFTFSKEQLNGLIEKTKNLNDEEKLNILFDFATQEAIQEFSMLPIEIKNNLKEPDIRIYNKNSKTLDISFKEQLLNEFRNPYSQNNIFEIKKNMATATKYLDLLIDWKVWEFWQNGIPETITNEDKKPNRIDEINKSEITKFIYDEFKTFHQDGWNYAFTKEVDFIKFVDLLTAFFENKQVNIPNETIKLKRNCKTTLSKVFNPIHNQYGQGKLKHDKKYFDIIRVLDHFKELSNNQIYSAITK